MGIPIWVWGRDCSYALSDDGTLFIGGTNRGWGSRGKKPFTVERVRWNGKVPFETKTMEALPDGFRLTFTEPADIETLTNLDSYKVKAWTYIYQHKYGSPEVDHVDANVTSARVAPDGLSVDLTVSPLTKGHIHHLSAAGVRSKKGGTLAPRCLLHAQRDSQSLRKEVV